MIWPLSSTAQHGPLGQRFSSDPRKGVSTGRSKALDSFYSLITFAFSPMAILAHTVQVPGGNPLVLYGETANLNYFLVGDLEPDEDEGATVRQIKAKGGKRRAYPGAPERSFSGSQREVLFDPKRRLGTAIPGQPFMLVETDAGSAKEKRQFTFHGRYIDLHAFLSASVSRNVRLLGPTGASTKIANSAPGP
jgi:hypothetical protein